MQRFLRIMAIQYIFTDLSLVNRFFLDIYNNTSFTVSIVIPKWLNYLLRRSFKMLNYSPSLLLKCFGFFVVVLALHSSEFRHLICCPIKKYGELIYKTFCFYLHFTCVPTFWETVFYLLCFQTSSGLQQKWNMCSVQTSLTDLPKDQQLSRKQSVCRALLSVRLIYMTSGAWPGFLLYMPDFSSAHTSEECLASSLLSQNKALWNSGRHVWHHYWHMLSVKAEQVNDSLRKCWGTFWESEQASISLNKKLTLQGEMFDMGFRI